MPVGASYCTTGTDSMDPCGKSDRIIYIQNHARPQAMQLRRSKTTRNEAPALFLQQLDGPKGANRS